MIMNEKKFFVHESSYIDDDVQIGEGTKIWHFCHVQKGARIGERCSFGQNVNISNNVVVGNSVKIQNNVSVYEGVELEDYVFCGPSCVFTNDLTPRAKYPKGNVGYKRTLVREGASIGANATITPINVSLKKPSPFCKLDTKKLPITTNITITPHFKISNPRFT